MCICVTSYIISEKAPYKCMYTHAAFICKWSWPSETKVPPPNTFICKEWRPAFSSKVCTKYTTDFNLSCCCKKVLSKKGGSSSEALFLRRRKEFCQQRDKQTSAEKKAADNGLFGRLIPVATPVWQPFSFFSKLGWKKVPLFMRVSSLYTVYVYIYILVADIW